MADALALLGTQNDDLYMEIIKENLDKRILVFNDEVTDAILENYILYILKWNQEDKNIPVESRKPILLYINSPGGECIIGFNFCSVILASTTPVYGVCFGLAASMGYHIFLSTEKRYAFKNSVLLQHDGSIELQNSTSKAKQTMQFFDNMETRTKQYVLERTSITEEFYDKIYDQEYYMYSDEAKKLGVVHYIIGEDCKLDDII